MLFQTFEIFRLIVRGKPNARKHESEERDANDNKIRIEEDFVRKGVIHNGGSIWPKHRGAEFGEEDRDNDCGDNHWGEISVDGRPNAKHRTLFRIVGQDVSGHIANAGREGVADNVKGVNQDEDRNTERIGEGFIRSEAKVAGEDIA